MNDCLMIGNYSTLLRSDLVTLMSHWNDTWRERAIREAFNRAGVDKANCYVHVAPSRARVCVYTSLGQVKTDAMRELLYRLDLFTGDHRWVLVTEGRRQIPRIIIDEEHSA
jgi:hypothetical protein